MSSSASNPTTADLLREIDRLMMALEAIQNTPRRDGILACQRIATQALRGGTLPINQGEASLGNPFYYARVREYLENRYKHRCAYCRLDADVFQIDHVIPVSRGGGDGITNLVLACVPCNKAKGAQTPGEFGFPDVVITAIGQVMPKWKAR